MATAVKNGKKYRAKAELIKDPTLLDLDQALAKVKELGYAKFDETIEIVFNLGIDPKKSDQLVRGTVNMPAGLGKKVRVAVVSSGESLKSAESAGADLVGSEDLIEKINGGFLDFDVLLATPDMMPKIGKLGKVLGRRGLMPTPKAGTVVTDVKKGVNEFKAGKAEFKTDKNGIIHSIVAKNLFLSNS
jgi:large subunit ribosomal protein L1